MKKQAQLRWCLPLLLVYVAGFIFAAEYDLLITQAVYEPACVFAVLMESFGWFPVFLPVVFLMALLVTDRNCTALLQRLLPGFVFVVGAIVMFVASYHYLQGRANVGGIVALRAPICIVTGTLFVVLMLFVALRIRESHVRRRVMFWCCWGTVYLVMALIVVNLVKIIWARTRFDTMLAAEDGFALFTPWYQPFGNGGTSFPSGHTANAAGIFVLLMLCDLFPAFEKHKKLSYVLCWSYIVIMAWTRIHIGRHFLSDTLAASAIMAGLFWLLRHNRWYNASLEKLKNTHLTEQGE